MVRLRRFLPLILLLLPVVVTTAAVGLRWDALASALAVGAALRGVVRVPLIYWRRYLLEPLVQPLPDPETVIGPLDEMAEQVRKEGVLSIEYHSLDFPPLAEARNRLVNGYGDRLEEDLQRERGVVLAQVAETRRGGLELFLALMLAAVPWGSVPAVVLAWVALLLTWGHFQRLTDRIDELYRLITVGFATIERGMPPFMTKEMLRVGQNFRWSGSAQPPRVPDSITIPWEKIEEKMEKYLASRHPSLHLVDIPWNENEPWERQFSDLALMESSSFRVLLPELDFHDICKAIRWAKPEVVRKFVNAHTASSASYMLEVLSWQSIPERTQVEAAQEVILRTARKMEKEGRIIIAKPQRDPDEGILDLLLRGLDKGADASRG